jgi:putative transposase
LVRELAGQGFPVAVTCRVLKISTSGYYEWRHRGPSNRDLTDAHLINTLRNVHAGSRQTYGVRRCHAELRLGDVQLRVAHKRVARLMRLGGLQGVHRRRWRHFQRATAVWEDRVQRRFSADRPNKLWFTDITQHRTAEGWVYCAAVLDVYSRRIVGWSIANHLRTELVVDALQMARWRRRNPTGTVVHSDRGPQYTSWLFGHRLREAGLLGSMGKVACAYDNSVIESFFGSLQIEVLDRRIWTTRAELTNAIFEWIEAFYNPTRRHSALGYLSPIDYENRDTTAEAAA